MAYEARLVDRAGNDSLFAEHEQFEVICEVVREALDRHPRRDFVLYIYNPDLADVDFDGLTDEERELLPC